MDRGETPGFFATLTKLQAARKTRICIGLDPDPARFPSHIADHRQPVFEFNRAIVDATHDLVSCYKPQIAHYASIAAEDQLLATIEYIKGRGVPVLLDAKRGDIGTTAQHYAHELFERYGADAVTINPYPGLDAMQPFLDYADKGIFILCRTSNPGGADIQDLMLDSGLQLHEHVASEAAMKWNKSGNVGLVVGATQPLALRRIRQLCGSMTLLLPGVGAQGGNIEALMAAGQGGGMLISSSRSILYAGQGVDFAMQARAAASNLRDEVNQYREGA